MVVNYEGDGLRVPVFFSKVLPGVLKKRISGLFQV